MFLRPPTPAQLLEQHEPVLRRIYYDETDLLLEDLVYTETFDALFRMFRARTGLDIEHRGFYLLLLELVKKDDDTNANADDVDLVV